jgi:aldose 1-epimerase
MPDICNKYKTHTLCDGEVSVTLLSLGAVTCDWQVPLSSGQRVPVVLGHADILDYARYPGHYGTIEGRVANRIGGGCFDLAGQRYQLSKNEGQNTLHGGLNGWSKRNWTLSSDGDRAVELRLKSVDGDQGMPGAVDVRLVVSLTGHCVTYDFEAWPDRETPINMCNHNYYALHGGTPIWQQQLQIASNHITESDASLIPTGVLKQVQGTKYDFREMRTIGTADSQKSDIDINYALNRDHIGPALTLRADNGLELNLCTDQPGLQVYTGHRVNAVGSALAGQRHGPAMGIAIEAQGYPDAVNHAHFPSIIYSPDRPYRQTTRISIQAH